MKGYLCDGCETFMAEVVIPSEATGLFATDRRTPPEGWIQLTDDAGTNRHFCGYTCVIDFARRRDIAVELEKP